METNAHEAYRAAREKLDERLNRLNHAIREHDEREFRDRANWGHVGNLGHVNEMLDEVIAFIGAKPEVTK